MEERIDTMSQVAAQDTVTPVQNAEGFQSVGASLEKDLDEKPAEAQDNSNYGAR